MTLAGMMERLFERATGTRVTPRSSAAIARFGPYLAGMVAAKALSIVGQLLVSRLLGPAEFGRVAVVLATANLLALPLTGAWGSAFVRYSVGQPRASWAPLLRWTTLVTIGASTALALAVVASAPVLAPLLAVPAPLLVTGALVAVCMAAWLLAKAACQGRESWGRFVASEMVWAAAIVVGSWSLARAGELRWSTATGLFALAYGAGALAAAPYFAAAFRSRGRASATAATRFGQLALLTGAGNTIFLYADRFVVQGFLGFGEVGVYQVYGFATVGVATLLATVLNNFAFPLFPQGDRLAFGALFGRTFARLLPVILPLLFLAGAAQIYLTRFPFRPGLLAIASLSATASLLAAFYGNLVLSEGVAGGQVTARVSGLSLLAFAVGVVPAVRLGGLAGLFGLYASIFLGAFVLYQRALASFAPPHTARHESHGVAGT